MCGYADYGAVYADYGAVYTNPKCAQAMTVALNVSHLVQHELGIVKTVDRTQSLVSYPNKQKGRRDLPAKHTMCTRTNRLAQTYPSCTVVNVCPRIT